MTQPYHPLPADQCYAQDAVGKRLTIGEYSYLLDPRRFMLTYSADIRSYVVTLRVNENHYVTLAEVPDEEVLKWKRPTRVFASIALRKEAIREQRNSNRAGKTDRK